MPADGPETSDIADMSSPWLCLATCSTHNLMRPDEFTDLSLTWENMRRNYEHRASVGEANLENYGYKKIISRVIFLFMDR